LLAVSRDQHRDLSRRCHPQPIGEHLASIAGSVIHVLTIKRSMIASFVYNLSQKNGLYGSSSRLSTQADTVIC
jgi:hypothetical protein